jgi:hypothetical protein
MRFIAIPPWHVDETHRQLAFELTAASLRIFSEYANYGLACSTYSSSTSLFRQIQDWVAKNPAANGSFTQAWFDLLESWSLCAVDPHSTTPEHDILWQETKEWGQHCLDVLEMEGLAFQTYTNIVRALSAWLQGAKRHDKPAFEAVTADLASAKVKRLIESASSEPVSEDKAKLLLALKTLIDVSSIAARLGDAAAVLQRIQVEASSSQAIQNDEWM